MNQQLLDYVKQARTAGMSDDQIKSELLSAGWQSSDVDSVLGEEVASIFTSSLNGTEEQNNFINKWSWGGFILHWVYFIPLRAPKKALLYFLGSLVPVFNIYLWIKIGLRGRKITWENGKWSNFDDYKKRQKLLDKIGLVVIIVLGGLAIVSFMASIVLLSLNSARIKGRDTQRYADARLIESSLMTYQEANHSYPVTLNELVPSYLNTVPVAPTPGQPYVYQPENSGSDYQLCVTFEEINKEVCGSKDVPVSLTLPQAGLPTTSPMGTQQILSAKATYMQYRAETDQASNFQQYLVVEKKYASAFNLNEINSEEQSLQGKSQAEVDASFQVLKSFFPKIADITEIQEEVNGNTTTLHMKNTKGENGTVSFVIENGQWKKDGMESWKNY